MLYFYPSVSATFTHPFRRNLLPFYLLLDAPLSRCQSLALPQQGFNRVSTIYAVFPCNRGSLPFVAIFFCRLSNFHQMSKRTMCNLGLTHAQTALLRPSSPQKGLPGHGLLIPLDWAIYQSRGRNAKTPNAKTNGPQYLFLVCMIKTGSLYPLLLLVNVGSLSSGFSGVILSGKCFVRAKWIDRCKAMV